MVEGVEWWVTVGEAVVEGGTSGDLVTCAVPVDSFAWELLRVLLESSE